MNLFLYTQLLITITLITNLYSHSMLPQVWIYSLVHKVVSIFMNRVRESILSATDWVQIYTKPHWTFTKPEFT